MEVPLHWVTHIKHPLSTNSVFFPWGNTYAAQIPLLQHIACNRSVPVAVRWAHRGWAPLAKVREENRVNSTETGEGNRRGSATFPSNRPAGGSKCTHRSATAPTRLQSASALRAAPAAQPAGGRGSWPNPISGPQRHYRATPCLAARPKRNARPATILHRAPTAAGQIPTPRWRGRSRRPDWGPPAPPALPGGGGGRRRSGGADRSELAWLPLKMAAGAAPPGAGCSPAGGGSVPVLFCFSVFARPSTVPHGAGYELLIQKFLSLYGDQIDIHRKFVVQLFAEEWSQYIDLPKGFVVSERCKVRLVPLQIQVRASPVPSAATGVGGRPRPAAAAAFSGRVEPPPGPLPAARARAIGAGSRRRSGDGATKSGRRRALAKSGARLPWCCRSRPPGAAGQREPLPDGSAAGAVGVLLRGKFCVTGRGGGRAAPRHAGLITRFCIPWMRTCFTQ